MPGAHLQRSNWPGQPDFSEEGGGKSREQEGREQREDPATKEGRGGHGLPLAPSTLHVHARES